MPPGASTLPADALFIPGRYLPSYPKLEIRKALLKSFLKTARAVRMGIITVAKKLFRVPRTEHFSCRATLIHIFVNPTIVFDE